MRYTVALAVGMSAQTTVAGAAVDDDQVSPSLAIVSSAPLTVGTVPAATEVGAGQLLGHDVVGEDRRQQVGVGEHRVEVGRRDLGERRVGGGEDRERALRC